MRDRDGNPRRCVFTGRNASRVAELTKPDNYARKVPVSNAWVNHKDGAHLDDDEVEAYHLFYQIEQHKAMLEVREKRLEELRGRIDARVKGTKSAEPARREEPARPSASPQGPTKEDEVEAAHEENRIVSDLPSVLDDVIKDRKNLS